MSATGIGSMPGVHVRESVKIITGELPEFIHVPELPARGPGADLIGRTAALLAQVAPDLAVDTVPTGWRVIDAPGATMRRALSWLHEDLECLEEEAAGYAGIVKAQLAGPWTLAAMIEGRNGERLIADSGATRDIAQALAVAAVDHTSDLRRRFPQSTKLVLQFDEPMLGQVLDGTIASASGLSRYRAIDEPVVVSGLSTVMAAQSAFVGVHTCESRPRVGVLRKSGAQFLSIDLTVVGDACDEELGVALEDGCQLFAGVVPVTADRMGVAQVARPIVALGERLGLSELIAMHTVVTPQCGLAGADPTWAVSAYRVCQQVARGLRDEEGERRGDEG